MKMATLPFLLCAVMLLSVSESQGLLIHCPSGWTMLYGRCFKYIAARLTWARAESHCLLLGGNLASVHNLNQYRALQGLIRQRSGASGLTWIGGTDASQEGVWLWSDGTRMKFYDWCRPTHHSNWNCLRINFSSRNCWDDHTCTDRHPFVCTLKRTLHVCHGRPEA